MSNVSEQRTYQPATLIAGEVNATTNKEAPEAESVEQGWHEVAGNGELVCYRNDPKMSFDKPISEVEAEANSFRVSPSALMSYARDAYGALKVTLSEGAKRSKRARAWVAVQEIVSQPLDGMQAVAERQRVAIVIRDDRRDDQVVIVESETARIGRDGEEHRDVEHHHRDRGVGPVIDRGVCHHRDD